MRRLNVIDASNVLYGAVNLAHFAETVDLLAVLVHRHKERLSQPPPETSLDDIRRSINKNASTLLPHRLLSLLEDVRRCDDVRREPRDAKLEALVKDLRRLRSDKRRQHALFSSAAAWALEEGGWVQQRLRAWGLAPRKSRALRLHLVGGGGVEEDTVVFADLIATAGGVKMKKLGVIGGGGVAEEAGGWRAWDARTKGRVEAVVRGLKGTAVETLKRAAAGREVRVVVGRGEGEGGGVATVVVGSFETEEQFAALLKWRTAMGFGLLLERRGGREKLVDALVGQAVENFVGGGCNEVLVVSGDGKCANSWIRGAVEKGVIAGEKMAVAAWGQQLSAAYGAGALRGVAAHALDEFFEALTFCEGGERGDRERARAAWEEVFHF
jgi:hypothetical protein